MKAIFKFLSVAIVTLFIFSCSKDDDNNGGNNNGNTIEGITVTTIDITNVKTILATTNNKIEVDATKATLTAKGIVWNTSTSPTIALTTKTIENNTSGNFESQITNLQHSTKYYVRAYATDNKGNTIYGNEISFTTKVGWKIIKGGSSYYMAIKYDGTLWGWGNNETGQIGDGTSISRNIPVQIGADNNWADVIPCNSTNSQGEGYWTMAIKNDGTLWGWGKGYLGDGAIVPRYNPTKIGNDFWKQISLGNSFSCGIKIDGTLWYWGFTFNPNTSSMSFASTPLKINGIANCKQVTCGYNNVLIIKNDGTLWGYGHDSGLGIGTPAYTNASLQQIGNANSWSKIYSSYNFSTIIATKIDGTLWGWGNGQFGQFGNSTNSSFNTPTLISNNLGSIVNDMSQPHASTFYVKTDGTLWGTGSGILGDGTPNSTSRFVFVQSGNLNTWLKVSKSFSGTTCAIQNNGSLWVCGINNNYGQLGIGDNNPNTEKLLFTLIE